MAELTRSTAATAATGNAQRARAQKARTARARAALALARERLRRSSGGRIAAVARAPLLVFFVGAAVLVRATDGGAAPLEGLISAEASWLAWLVGGPLALAAAQDRRALDRSDGIEALAAARGLSRDALAQARVLGAMAEITAAIGVPLLALVALTIAVAGSARLALYRALLALGAAAFAAVTGVTLGGLGAACAELGGARGRSLFAAVILGPYLLADLTGHPALSIPGALAAALSYALGGAGA